MRCLVTGGAGFIGSNLVDRLIKDGHSVICVDDESAESNEKFYWNDEAENYVVDICDHEKLLPLFEGVDYVFHLAAESRIQPAIENPIRAVKVNCEGTCSVMQAARAANVKRVIYSSTSSAYGLTEACPQMEDFPEDCLNPYSVSKVAGEKICKMYSDLFGVETIIFRYFNVYGERSPTSGQYAPVLGIFLRQRDNNEPLTIVGSGENLRDYVHVYDVVDANVKAMKEEIDSSYFGQVFNIGSGVNYSVKHLADVISTNSIHIDERLGEAKTTLSKCTKMEKVFGWKSTIDVIEWLSDK